MANALKKTQIGLGFRPVKPVCTVGMEVADLSLSVAHMPFCWLCRVAAQILKNDFNPLYTGGLFHCFILDESVCHFRDATFILFMENSVSKHCRP